MDATKEFMDFATFDRWSSETHVDDIGWNLTQVENQLMEILRAEDLDKIKGNRALKYIREKSCTGGIRAKAMDLFIRMGSLREARLADKPNVFLAQAFGLKDCSYKTVRYGHVTSWEGEVRIPMCNGSVWVATGLGPCVAGGPWKAAIEYRLETPAPVETCPV